MDSLLDDKIKKINDMSLEEILNVYKAGIKIEENQYSLYNEFFNVIRIQRLYEKIKDSMDYDDKINITYMLKWAYIKFIKKEDSEKSKTLVNIF